MAHLKIEYEALAQAALRGVVRHVLKEVSQQGLPDSHHFYVCFNTRADGVGLSKRLRDQYPDEMTIVLQHRFWDLIVHEDRFEVKLTFNSIPERLVVPFDALKVFVDPSVPFSLQFEAAALNGAARRVHLSGLPAAGDDVADSRGTPPATGPRVRLRDARSQPPGLVERAADNDKPSAHDGRGDDPRPPSLTVVEDKKATADVVSLDAFRKK